MKRLLLHSALVAVAVGAVSAASSAIAHHSFAAYDQTKTVTLKGTVKSLQWTNPHVTIWVYVETADGADPQLWTVETTSPGVLTRSGWTRHSLKPGDKVSIDIRPRRDGSRGGGLEKVTLLETGEVLRANFAASEKANLK
jgi:hypothetical protein